MPQQRKRSEAQKGPTIAEKGQARNAQRSAGLKRGRRSTSDEDGPLESVGKAVSAPVRETADEEEGEKGDPT